MKIDLKLSSLFRAPHAFISKAGEAVMISLLKREEDAALLEMYLVYEPRNSFSGLPPIEDGACVMWVKHMVEQGINLRATSFKHGLVGHTALFPMPQSKCEMLVVVAPGHQAMGIGTELTRCAIELAHETGFDEMWLSVEARNHMARHMYAKCGFQRLRQYGDDDVEMTYDLARHHRVQSNSIAEFVREAASVDMRTTCAEAAELIIRHHVSALPAVDGDGRVIGIVAATDLLSAANPRELVTSVVTHDVVTVGNLCTISEVVQLLRTRRLRCVPVVDENRRLIGVVGRREVLQHYLQTVWSPATESVEAG
ncbi:MAG: GNAT family N-acetyltransferase [Deltaproteobacteria bacterium]|nr:GNAT family N-acetyltransferase [Deltaproteobacteria bacterium]